MKKSAGSINKIALQNGYFSTRVDIDIRPPACYGN